MRRFKFLPLLAMSALLTFCSEPPPPPAPSAPPPAAPAPSPSQPPALSMNWRYAPLTPGGWAYKKDTTNSSAIFGSSGAQISGGPPFIFACDRARRIVSFDMFGVGPNQFATFRTTFGDLDVPVGYQGGDHLRVSGGFSVSHPFLDKIAYSLGRIAVEMSGKRLFILPAWPEVARVIEDCRG